MPPNVEGTEDVTMEGSLMRLPQKKIMLKRTKYRASIPKTKGAPQKKTKK
jgi:hypothetical protein